MIRPCIIAHCEAALPSQGRAKPLQNAEVGRGIFGARYYDANIGVWLSVDPMADKYPYQSGYCYVGWRPLMVIDPNGLWEQDADGNWVAQKGDSWWSLHKKSGMSWEETMTFAKNYNAARGQENWKHVNVGDVVTLPGIEQSSHASNANNGTFNNETYSNSTQNTQTKANSSHSNNSGSSMNSALTAAAIACAYDGPFFVGDIIGGVILTLGIINTINNPVLPGPYYTERGQPWNPNPPQIDPYNRFPNNNPNVNKIIKYTVYGAGAVDLGRRLYEGTKPGFNPYLPSDNKTTIYPDKTNVVMPIYYNISK